MKAIFYFFSNFFADFLPEYQRAGGQKANQRHQIGGEMPQFEHRTAEREKISGAADQNGEDSIDADLPLFHGQGPQKQSGGGGQPEQQVEQPADPPQTQPGAQHPHQVIKDTQGEPQACAAGESCRLRGEGDFHTQPKSREKKPPRSRRPSS